MDTILPLEVLTFIFNKLSLKDLLNCRLVSNNFKFIADQIKIKELTIQNGLIPKIRTNWFYTNTEFKNVISTNLKFPIHRLFRSSFLENLKSLMINYLLDDHYPKFNLNNLKSLEQLQIDYLFYCNNYNLNLNNLRILFLNNLNSSITIDCPKLEYFHYPNVNHSNQNLITFKQTESIKYLEVYRFYDNNLNLLSEFKNIQYLIINQFQPNYNSYPTNNQINFNLFTKLKCIHVFATFKLNLFAELSFIERLIKNSSFNSDKIKIYCENKLINGFDNANRLILLDNENDQQLIDNQRIDFDEATQILHQILNNQH